MAFVVPFVWRRRGEAPYSIAHARAATAVKNPF